MTTIKIVTLFGRPLILAAYYQHKRDSSTVCNYSLLKLKPYTPLLNHSMMRRLSKSMVGAMQEHDQVKISKGLIPILSF